MSLLELSEPEDALAIDARGAHAPRLGRAPDVTGTLGDSPLPHLLVHMVRRALTGTLVLRGPVGADVLVFVRRGAPAKLASELTSSPLGEILVRMGALTTDELDDAVAHARRNREPLGVHLVREGWIERPVLHAALRRQILERLAATQALPPQTTYEFYEGEDLATSFRGEAPVPCDPLAALLATVRAWREVDRIDNSLSRLADVRLALHREAAPARFGLLGSERLVVDAITKWQPTLEQLRRLGLDAAAIRATVYALAIARHLAVGGDPELPLCVIPRPPVVDERFEPRPPRRDPRGEPTRDSGELVVDVDLAELDPHPTPSTTMASIAPRSDGPMRAAELARSLIPPPMSKLGARELEKAPRSVRSAVREEGPSVVDRFLAAGDQFARAERALAVGDFPTARREAEKAVDADPSRPEFRALSTFARALGAPAYDQLLALQALDRIVREAPSVPRALRYRAQLLHLLGETARAKRDYESALALDPGDEVAAQGLASISAVDARRAREAR